MEPHKDQSRVPRRRKSAGDDRDSGISLRSPRFFLSFFLSSGSRASLPSPLYSAKGPLIFEINILFGRRRSGLIAQPGLTRALQRL